MKQADKLYDKYVKPLENKHQGKFVAVNAVGKSILGDDLLEVVQKSVSVFGPGNLIFKVGEKSVGKWR